MNYIRIHANYLSSITGQPCGIFGAIHGLKNREKLNDKEMALFQEIEKWFTEHLPEPDFYKSNSEIKAVSWFKETSEEMIAKLIPLISVLESHGVEYTISKSENPGNVVYEDEFQVCTTQNI